MFGKVRPEVDGPVRERAVLVNKNTDKLLTVNSRHVNKSTFCDMLTVDIPTVYLSTVYFYTPPWMKGAIPATIKLAMDTRVKFGLKRTVKIFCFLTPPHL